MFSLKYALNNAVRLWRETLSLLFLSVIITAVIAVTGALAEHSIRLYNKIEERHTVSVELIHTVEGVLDADKLENRYDFNPEYGLVKELAEHEAVEYAAFVYSYDVCTPYIWQYNFDENADMSSDHIFRGKDIIDTVLTGTVDSDYIPYYLSHVDTNKFAIQGDGIHDVDGSMNGERVAVIPKTLAETKGLSIGDTFTVAYPCVYDENDPEYDSDISDTLLSDEFTVIGICDDTYDFDYDFDTRASTYLYIPLSTIEKYYELDDSHRVSYVSFVLKHPDSAYDFIEYAVTKIGDQPLALEANDYEYKREAYPSATARDLNSAIGLASAVTGIILLLILSLVLVRIRKKELKTLSLIGCHRSFIVMSYTAEKLIITAVGALIGITLGAVICVTASQLELFSYDVSYIISDFSKSTPEMGILLGTAAILALISSFTLTRKGKLGA